MKNLFCIGACSLSYLIFIVGYSVETAGLVGLYSQERLVRLWALSHLLSAVEAPWAAEYDGG